MNEIEFVLAKETDASTIAELRQNIWSTTYRGIYPDEMIDSFDYKWHTQNDLKKIKSSEYLVWLIMHEKEKRQKT